MKRSRNKLFIFIFIGTLVACFSYTLLSNKTINILSKSGSYYEQGTSNITRSYLLNDVVYNGTISTYKIGDDFGNGVKIYSNIDDTLVNTPYKYVNAEYIQLPSADANIISDNILSFNVTRAVDIYVLRDKRVLEVPSWLSTYEKQSETINSSTNVEYDVYKLSVPSSLNGTTVIIGGNIDNIENLNNGLNQVVFVKETNKVNNRKFFFYDFDDITQTELDIGFDKSSIGNTSITPQLVTDNLGVSKNALSLYDNELSIMAYIRKGFNPITENFSVEYKAYVTYDPSERNTTKNNWLRMFVRNGYKADDDDKNSLLAEAYLHRQYDALTVYVRDKNNSAQTLANNITLNEWHTFRFDFDFSKKTYILYVDGVKGNGVNNGSTTIPMFRNVSNNSASFITFGTGKSHLSNYAIDDVVIKPDMDIGATSIKVAGKTIELDETLSSYVITTNIRPVDATYILTKTDDYFTHNIDKTTYDNKAHIVIKNNNSEEYEFDVNFVDSTIFDGISVRGDVEKAIAEEIDGKNCIHITDDSTTDLTYIEKSFESINTALRLSYDVYFNDISENSMIKSLITNNPIMSNYTELTSTVVNSYINPIGQTADLGFKLISNTTLDDTTIIQKNTWHNVKYEVNLVDKIYKVYLDNNLIYGDYDFYTQQTSVNNFVIGSDLVGKADFYVSNIVAEEMNGSPLEEITINGVKLPDFNKNNSVYNYYTDKELKNDTEVFVTYNTFYKSHTLNIDTQNKKIFINVTDNLDNIITYTVNFSNPINRGVTIEELEELYNSALILSESSDNYTEYTWSFVETAMANANRVINDDYSSTTDYAYQYYLLEKAMNELLEYDNNEFDDNIDIIETNSDTTYRYSTTCVETDNNSSVLRETKHYDVSLVKDITHSSDLNNVFGFEKVLQNGSNAYMKTKPNDQFITFTSVPYKYMNSEYITMKNIYYNNSSIKLTSTKNIYLIIFKDWDTGPLTSTIKIGNNTYTFNDTKEIVTTSDNKVYKVYQSSEVIPTNTTFEIYGNDLINNRIGSNNIVGFIKSSNANNTFFFNENMSDYADTEDFSTSWDNMISCNIDNHTKSTVNSHNIIASNGTKYLEMFSSDGYEIPIVTKSFANLYEKVEFDFTMMVDSKNGTISSQNNKWLRAWLTNFSSDPGNGRAITGSSTDKPFVLAEFYTGATGMIYNYNRKRDNDTIPGTLTADNWYDYKLILDIKNQTFTIDVVPHGESTSICASRASGDCTPTNNFFFNNVAPYVTVANHAYFSGRGSSSSLSKVESVNVTPLKSGMYNNILIDGVSIGNDLYQDLTKNYLYKYDPSIENNLQVTLNNGSTTLTSESISYYPSNNSKNNMEYVTINSESSVGSRTYKVYFEADEENKKAELTDLVDEALSLNKIVYTEASYNALLSELENSKNGLKNHKITSSEVQVLIDNLRTAMDNLANHVGFSITYNSKITKDYNYTNFDNDVVNITDNSSLTTNFLVNYRLSEEGYKYDGLTHHRYFVSSTPFKEGTKLTLIDKDYDGNSNIYYYNVTGSDYSNNKMRYSLNDFIKMGTINEHFNKTYDYNITTRRLFGSYTVIVDFSSSDPLDNGEYGLSFELEISSNVVSSTTVLNYNIYSVRNNLTMSTSFNKPYYSPSSKDGILNVDLDVSDIVVDGINVTDTEFSNLKTGFKFTLLDSTGEEVEPFTKGLVIKDKANNQEYTLDNDNVFRISNSSNINSIDKYYAIYSLFDSLKIGNYKIKVDLMGLNAGINNESNDENILESSISDVTIRRKPTCSIKANIINREGIIDLSKQNTFDTNIEVLCNNITEDSNVTVSLYKKNNSLFSDFRYTKIDISDYLNIDYDFTQYNNMENTYLIDTISYEGLPSMSEEIHLDSLFNSSMPQGTYKVVFDVRTGSSVVSDFYTFYVK